MSSTRSALSTRVRLTFSNGRVSGSRSDLSVCRRHLRQAGLDGTRGFRSAVATRESFKCMN
jgi:hypothetical protein